MSTPQLDMLVRSAIAQGVLPETATAPATDMRPWPVVLLTALGAWLAALPLLVAAYILFSELLNGRLGLYLVGALLLAAAIVVLRSRSVPVFFEQLAVVALLVGGGALGAGLRHDLSHQECAAALSAIALTTAVLVAQPWLRALLGFAAAGLLFLASASGNFSNSHSSNWTAWHVCLLLWLVAGCTQRMVLDSGVTARAAAVLESISAGWILATIAGLALWSGMTFLAGGVLGGDGGGPVRGLGASDLSGQSWTAMQTISTLLAAIGALWVARKWPAACSPWHAGVALVLTGLAWFMPSLGAALLIAAVCATGTRWRLATVAAFATVWIVGSFYYQLTWPLATKALVMLAAAALLGTMAWLSARAAVWRTSRPADSRFGEPLPVTRPIGTGIGTAITAVAVLAAANIGIWQNESLIARGQPVFIELQPADPRSLMQGDFMRLRFRLPAELQSDASVLPELSNLRPQVIASRDARGIAQLLRIASPADRLVIDVRKENPGMTDAEYVALGEGQSLPDGELRIELTPKDGRWVVVTDAWFFKEGEADRWSQARYGEFRVDGKGRALLVGLRGANLEVL